MFPPIGPWLHPSPSPPPLYAQLPLLSAYASMHSANGAADSRLQKQKQRLDARHHEPNFTNATRDFKGTLDYILYTNNSLQVCARVHVCVWGGWVGGG